MSLTFLFGWVAKVVYERYTLKYKLKLEYNFGQKKKLKEEIVKNKIELLNITEDLNHRLWNFNINISENWHKISKYDWENRTKYYTRSFVYRFLVFIHLVLKTEKDIKSIDTVIADKKDILFLKYIKTFKDIFCEPQLLKDLNYSGQNDTNHFFKNNLIGLSKLVLNENQVVLDFEEFKTKTVNNYIELEKVINYFTEINDDKYDKNLNVLRCFHLIIINFLNEFGHDYQKTSTLKKLGLWWNYRDKIRVTKRFKKFIKKSKLYDILFRSYFLILKDTQA